MNTNRARIISSHLATLFPGYFALVMATGIVSLALHFQGKNNVALALFGLNLVAYLVLWGLTLARLVWFRSQLLNDLTQHSRGAAFLTKAAGTCVLGSQFALLTPWMRMAAALWFFGAGLGLVLSYVFFTAMTTREPKPSLESGINGAWLLIIVATESISVLGAQVASSLAATQVILFIALATYLVGAMLYGFFATLILYRWMFFSLRPEQFTPDYWIDMGGLAITTLAGALLIKVGPYWALLQTLVPFLIGLTICFWAAATWWIPLLLAVEAWRHLRSRASFSYTPDYWALVFPLGMYAVATSLLVKVIGLTFLEGIAEFFAYVALVAWAIVFTGMLHLIAGLLRSLLRRHNSG